MRPQPNTSSDRVYKEIKVIRDYLEDKAGKGECEVEFDESGPQQDKKNTSCGVYALKFVEHIIRGIHLSESNAIVVCAALTQIRV
ncbi:hypothetical protein MKW94_026687 [Papaver nudicaule]|uniref:Uncharacterized protein n=1 Tax=Papaver nudicaule TaxID=74823 RepID=A0AA41S7P4_PAPNU|nr:hypothetical protein [Papaver nudicaule]